MFVVEEDVTEAIDAQAMVNVAKMLNARRDEMILLTCFAAMCYYSLFRFVG